MLYTFKNASVPIKNDPLPPASGQGHTVTQSDNAASIDNPMFNNPALRGSMKDLHVNAAVTSTTNKRGVGSINLAGTREELQEQTV